MTVKRALAHLDERRVEISDQRAVIEADIHCTQGEVMKMKTTIIKQVKELTATFQPDVLKPNTEANIEFITSADAAAMCRNYGRIGVPGSPDTSQCHATGKGLEVAVVGEESTAFVQTNNLKGEPCEKQVTLQCELVSELTGVVVRGNVRRTSTRSTTNLPSKVLIKIKDQHIRGSPFPVTAKMPVEKLGTPIRTIDGLNRPWGVAINKKGEMIVTEFCGHCITVFSPSGEKLQSFGTHGSDLGQLHNPRGVAVDGKGNLLVLIIAFKSLHQMACSLHLLVQRGEGLCSLIVLLALHSNACNNKIYVADYGNNRIQVLNSDLTYFSTFGEMGSGKGQFYFPRGVSCDSAGNVYVADTLNHHIQVFTAQGKYVRMFGQHDGGGELDKLTGIAVDADGVVYVSEYDNHRVSLFTSKGQFLMSFDDEVVGPKGPIGLSIDINGVLYVCDHSNNCVQLF